MNKLISTEAHYWKPLRGTKRYNIPAPNMLTVKSMLISRFMFTNTKEFIE